MTRRAIWVGVAQCVSWGVLFYSFGLVLPTMSKKIKASPALLAGAFSTALLVTALVGFRVGHWIDGGRAWVVFVGGLFIGALGLLGWAASRTVGQLYLS